MRRRHFEFIGDELTFGGVTVAHMSPGISATLRDELEQFLDGLTLDALEDARTAGRKEAEAEHAGAYDDGYRDGYDAGRRNHQG